MSSSFTDIEIYLVSASSSIEASWNNSKWPVSDWDSPAYSPSAGQGTTTGMVVDSAMGVLLSPAASDAGSTDGIASGGSMTSCDTNHATWGECFMSGVFIGG